MKFITLGPSGSNHEFVARRYLDFHGLHDRATLHLAPDFEQGAAAVLQGDADFLLQCAVHPATASTMARWFDGLFAIDTFIAPSQDLAIVQRNDVERPRSLAVMAPTLDYIDASEWEQIEHVQTVAHVTQGLVDGRYAAGLAYASVVRAHPEHLRITRFIGTVDDAWIVYGRERATEGPLLAWHDSPAGSLYRRVS
jgi:hypothetical protein